MTDDLPLTLDDYRSLAAFLEGQLNEPESLTPVALDELRTRLVRIHLLLGDDERAAVISAQLTRHEDEAEAFQLTSAPASVDPARPQTAMELIESELATDPSDDDLRARYLEAARAGGHQIRAAGALARVAGAAKSNEGRERVWLDVGILYLEEGELPQARVAFLQAVLGGAASPAALAAAQRLLDLQVEPSDPEVVGPALDVIVRADPDQAKRETAAARLLALHEIAPQKDVRLLDALQALVGSAKESDAITWLIALRVPDPEAYSKLLSWLKQANAWESLARVLSAELEATEGDDRAERFAQLGTIRIVRCNDMDGALDAFRRCLELDPANEVARSAVERLMTSGPRRLAAADILEEVYRRVPSDDGTLRLLETRAELLPDGDARLGAFRAAADLAQEKAGDPKRSIRLCRHALEADPSSPDWLRRLDELLGDSEDPRDRLGRYEAGVARATTPERRRDLRRTIAKIRRDTMGDLGRATDVWQAMLEDDPTDLEAIGELLDASDKVDEPGPLLMAVAGARRSLRNRERHQITERTARALSRHGDRESALALCRELFDDSNASPATLEVVAEIAHDEEDAGLYRGTLEVLARVDDPAIRRRTLERLGDLHFRQLGSPRAAADAWRQAADLYEAPPIDVERELANGGKDRELANGGKDRELANGYRGRARSLLEHVLEAVPDDGDAAVRLVRMYAESRDWTKLPAVFRIVAARSAEPTDLASALLDLEANAIEAGAAEEFATLVDEVLTSIGPGHEKVAELRRAKAKVLASDASSYEEASKAYRTLVETFGSEQDVHAFEKFVEARSSSEDRQQDRRWLFAWRAEHEVNRADVLLEWAKAEEEFGDADAAIALYERVAKQDSGQRDALEALCRLRLHAGDFEGGLGALRALREASTESQQGPITLRMARVLLEDLGRPAEAAVALAPLVGAAAAVPEARTWLLRALAVEAEREPIISRLVRLAEQSPPATAIGIYRFLVSARVETADMPEARREWLQRIIELTGESSEALTAAIEATAEAPEYLPLWDAAERIARQLAQPDAVSRAYHAVLTGCAVLEPELAETLARRMIAFEDECGSESSRLVDALIKTLDLSPGARWAIDRVKLVLGSQARWDELFRLYDRAIAAAPNDAQRASLLDEAAFAAKDLAARPDRAIVYLESIHELKPNDPAVDAALERLYERQGQTGALIELYEARLKRATGFKHRELRHRIASLWLDLESAEQATEIVEQMLGESSSVADVATLLERIAAQPAPRSEEPTAEDAPEMPQKRAIAILKAHYENGGRADDVVRMAERELALAVDPEQRARLVRDLVLLRLSAAAQKVDAHVFTQVIPQVESDVANDPALAKIAFETLLQQTVSAWKHPPSSAYDDAEDGAWTTVHLLYAHLLEHDQASGALSLLYRSSRLAFERPRRRDLLREAALVCADRLNDRVRAVRVFQELFDDDAGDDAAARSLDRFAELLEESNDLVRLAHLWEKQSSVHASAGHPVERELASGAVQERACWERAALLWERQGDVDKALADYEKAAALESPTAFEALARIHSARQDWAEAAKTRQWLVAHAPGEIRGLRALELAEAYVQLGDRDGARGCLESALTSGIEAARADQVPEYLIGLYRQDAAWRPLARLLEAEAKRVTALDRPVALLREAADLHRNQLEEPAEAARLLELAVSWAQKDMSLRPLLADVLESLEQWDKIVLVLKDQIALYRDQRSKSRALVHHRIARALTRAGKAERALAELQTAIEMHPAHPVILYDLGRAALATDKVDLAESTYRALLLALHHSIEEGEDEKTPALVPPHRAEVFIELSEVALRKDDPTRAADSVDSAVQAALESGQDPKRFEAPLRERGRFELLARAVEARVERAASLEGRAVALGDLAELWALHLERGPDLGARIADHAERIGRGLEHERLTDAAAWGALSSVERWLLEPSPRSRASDESGERARASDESGERARASDARAPLAIAQRRLALLHAAIADLPAGAERNRLRTELAKFHLEDPAQTGAAIALLQSVVDDDPTDQASAEVLAGALEREGRFGELVVVLERRLKSSPVEGDAAPPLAESLRLGRALERAERASDARRVYEGLVDHPGIDKPGLAALAERLEVLRSERLGDCFERLLAAGDAGAGLAERLLRLRDDAGDAAGARRALELGLRADPGNPMFLPRLIDEHRKAGNHLATLQVLDAALARKDAPDPGLLSLRSETRANLGDDDGALFDLESASVAEERYVDALLELHEKIVAKQSAKADGGRLPAVADAYAIRVVDVLIQANRLDQVHRELERLLARTPTHADGLERMAGLLSHQGKWQDAIDVYRRLLPLVEQRDRETYLRVVLATADACERAGHAETARESLELALGKAPDSREVIQRLERVCEITGDFARLANLLLSEAERPENAAERTRLLVRAGTLLLESAGEATRAFEIAERARSGDDESVDAVLLSARARVALGQAHEALAVLGETMAKNRGKRSPLIARVHLEIAKAHLALDEVVEGFESLKSGFSMDWRNGDIAILLGLVAIDLDDEKTAERALSGVTAMPARKIATGDGVDPAAQATAFYHLAMMAYTKGDRGKARRLAGKTAGIDPHHAGATALLKHLEPGAGVAVRSPRSTIPRSG